MNPSYIEIPGSKRVEDDNRYPNFSLVEYLEEQGIQYAKRDSNDHVEYSTNCPKCVDRGEERPDTKQRLWVNPKKGIFFCYNCKWNGPLARLVQHFSNASYQTALKILKGKSDDPISHLNFKLRDRVIENDLDEDEVEEIDLPEGYTPFTPRRDNVFTEYLKYRGIPILYAMNKEWGYCESGYLRNRIIVPTYIGGKCVFWQARDVLEDRHDDWDTDNYRKVRNPKGVSASKILYNYDDAKRYQEIVLVEGFIDAVKVGDHAMATNGKHLHPSQMDLLTKTEAESIVILWDYDAHHDEVYKDGKVKHKCSVDRAMDMLRSCFQVHTVKLPEGTDPGDYEIGELDEILTLREGG